MASDARHTLKSHLLDMLAYDRWASERVIAAVDALPEGEAKDQCVRLTSHLLRAGTRWLERIVDERDTTTDKVDAIPAQLERAEANYQAWTALLEERTAADFAKDVHYARNGEETYANELRSIVAHVLNHATHHRGQVVRHIRLAGFEPPCTDLIIYDRERRAREDEGV